MRSEFRRDQCEASLCPPNGQLNIHASQHSEAGQLNRLMTLHPPYHSIACLTNESHQQQQKLLMLQRGFISSITKQLASDLNDVANVLRNSKQQKTTTDVEKTASGFLREINCRFMELGPVCAQYKQLFRCLPDAGPPVVSLPDCQRLYEHEQILKNCCDSLGKAFGELKSHHLHQNQTEQKSRTYTWLLSKKTILCNCIDALKRVLDNVVLECAPYQRDTQKPLPTVVVSDKTSAAPNTLPCTSPLKLCSSANIDLPVTCSSVGSCLTISEHSTADAEKATFDCNSQQTLVPAVNVGSNDSSKAFDCVELNRSQGIYSQPKNLLDNDIELEEKEPGKKQERELKVSRTEGRTLRIDATESTSEGEEGNRHQILRSKSCSGSTAADSASELKQISLDFNANESLPSEVNQEPRKGQNPEAAAAEICIHRPIETNGVYETNDERLVVVVDSAMNKNDDIAETEGGSFLNTNAAMNDRCVSVEPDPNPIPLEHGSSSSLISLAQSSSRGESDFLPIIKIEREDGQDGGVCHASQPSHTIIFDADDFSPPSNDTTGGADDWLRTHLTWEKKPIPVNANPRMEIVRPNEDEGNGSRVEVKGTTEGDEIPPLLTPSCAFDPKALPYCMKFDEDEPPVLEANDTANTNDNHADDRNTADYRRQIHDSSVDAFVCKPSSCAPASTGGPVTLVRCDFQGSGSSPGDLAAKFCFGRIVGEMILPKDDDAATNESGDRSVFGGKMERCFSSDDVTNENPPIPMRPADGLSVFSSATATAAAAAALSVSDDVKVECLLPEIQSVGGGGGGGGQFDCGYEFRFKDAFETLNSEAPFVLTIKPDDDFDPDSVCFLESQTTDGAEADDTRSSATIGGHVDGKNELEPTTESFQRGENLASEESNMIIASHEKNLLVAGDPLTENQMDASTTESVSEMDHRATSNDADRPKAALPSSASPGEAADGGPPAPLSVSISTSMTVFSESPESPSPESNAVCPTFHGIISAAAAAAARSEVLLKQQAMPSRKRKRRHKHADQKPVVVKAKEEKRSADEEEKEQPSRADEDAAQPPLPLPAKGSYVPSWSRKMSNCAAAGQELRRSFTRFVAFQSSLLTSSTQFKAKSESNRTEKSFIDEDKDSEKRERDEKHRLNHDPDGKIEGSDESRRSGGRRSSRRSNSGAGLQQDSWHRRSSRTSSRGTGDSEYEIKHLELLRNERKSNRWSSDRSSKPRRGCSSKGVSSPDRTRFPETRQQQQRDLVRLRSPLGRTGRRLSRSRSGDRNRSRDARRITTTHRHHFGGNEETRWRRSEVKVQGHRRVDCSRRCDDDDDDRSSFQRISDPSKLKRQFWSRGHPRFRCHDGCDRCPAAETDDAAAASSSAGSFSAHPRNRNDIMDETLLVNLRATRTDVNLVKDDDDDDEGERAVRRRTVKREHEEEKEEPNENGRRRSKASSSNHDSEQDAKRKRKKEEEEEEEGRARFPVGKKEKSRTPSSQPMTPASSSNCGSDYAHLPRRTAIDPDSDFEERTSEGNRRQTRFDQVSMLRSPLHDAGATRARPGVASLLRVAAPTYVTEVLKTKNFSTEVSFERFKS